MITTIELGFTNDDFVKGRRTAIAKDAEGNIVRVVKIYDDGRICYFSETDGDYEEFEPHPGILAEIKKLLNEQPK